MRLFSRNKDKSHDIDPVFTEANKDDDVRTEGPWDIDDEPDLGARIDFGAVRIPARRGMKLRIDRDKRVDRLIGVTVALGGSTLEVRAFAAPRSEGLWEEIRETMRESVTKQGGGVAEQEGPFGPELLCKIPVKTKDGRVGLRPVRFWGVDGPRWFLRGAINGQAAVDAEAGAAIAEVFRDIVVVRGTQPRAPRELLAVTPPVREQAPEGTKISTEAGDLSGADPEKPA